MKDGFHISRCSSIYFPSSSSALPFVQLCRIFCIFLQGRKLVRFRAYIYKTKACKYIVKEEAANFLKWHTQQNLQNLEFTRTSTKHSVARCLKITEKVSLNITSEACGQTVLTDNSNSIGQKLVEMPKLKNSNETFLSNFQTLCKYKL